MSARRGISRRRFVALAGAGLVAVVGSGAAAAPASTRKKPAATSSKPATATSTKPAAAAGGGTQKEFDRQKASTQGVLKTLRAYALPPGGDLPVVFKPMRAPRKGH